MSRRARREEHGAAAVEFALVVPFLLLILFGIISYGWMLSFRQALSQGAAEGARAAAVTVADDDAGRTAAALASLNDSLDLYGVSCSGGSLFRGGTAVGTCSLTIAACANDTAAQCATVDVDYRYADHPLLPDFPLVPLPDSLHYSAVARVS
ncbi:MAG TPA: TadE/TadG family type IV pilus assembly protein [Nocardioides sp.]|nr:TadE/TadG family type IV pilus assembly protein [Nocardioides sp.]